MATKSLDEFFCQLAQQHEKFLAEAAQGVIFALRDENLRLAKNLDLLQVDAGLPSSALAPPEKPHDAAQFEPVPPKFCWNCGSGESCKCRRGSTLRAAALAQRSVVKSPVPDEADLEVVEVPATPADERRHLTSPCHRKVEERRPTAIELDLPPLSQGTLIGKSSEPSPDRLSSSMSANVLRTTLSPSSPWAPQVNPPVWIAEADGKLPGETDGISISLSAPMMQTGTAWSGANPPVWTPEADGELPEISMRRLRSTATCGRADSLASTMTMTSTERARERTPVWLPEAGGAVPPLAPVASGLDLTASTTATCTQGGAWAPPFTPVWLAEGKCGTTPSLAAVNALKSPEVFFELHGAPAYMTKEVISQVCEQACGVPPVKVDAPMSKASGASWVVECQTLKQTEQCREFLDGLRLWACARGCLRVQDLSHLECVQRGLPARAEEDDEAWQSFLPHHLKPQVLLGAVGGIPALGFLSSRAPSWQKAVIHALAFFSLAVQFLGAVGWAVAALTLDRDEVFILHQTATMLFGLALCWSCLAGCGFAIEGLRWYSKPYPSNFAAAIFKECLAYADIQELDKPFETINCNSSLALAAVIIPSLLMAWVSGLPQTINKVVNGGGALASAGFIVSVCSTSCFHRRSALITYLVKRGLLRLSHDLSVGTLTFREWRFRFSRLWQVTAHCQEKDTSCMFLLAVTAMLVCFLSVASTVLLIESGSHRDRIFVACIFLVAVLAGEMHLDALWRCCTVSETFEKALASVFRWQAASRSLHTHQLMEVSNFLMYCRDPVVRRLRPMGMSVLGFEVTRGVVWKALFTTTLLIGVCVAWSALPQL